MFNCPECDSDKIFRVAIMTTQVVQQYNDKEDIWYTSEQIEEKLHSDSFMYFCELCDFETEDIEDFQQS